MSPHSQLTWVACGLWDAQPGPVDSLVLRLSSLPWVEATKPLPSCFIAEKAHEEEAAFHSVYRHFPEHSETTEESSSH